MRGELFCVTFNAQDFDETLRFYQEVLQLDYQFGWDEADGRGANFALTDHSEIEFFGAARGQAQTEPPPRDMKLAVMVDDVDAEYARLRSQVELVDELDDRPWGDRSFGFTDPNGIHIYFFRRSTSATN